MYDVISRSSLGMAMTIHVAFGFEAMLLVKLQADAAQYRLLSFFFKSSMDCMLLVVRPQKLKLPIF